jgi:hypothetical protein
MRAWPYEHLAQRDDVILSSYHIWEAPVLIDWLPGDQFNRLEAIAASFNRVYAVPTLDSIRTVVSNIPEHTRIIKGFVHQPYSDVMPALWSRRKRKPLVLIANYNLAPSRLPEYYSERVRAVGHFARLNTIDLYGRGWDLAAEAGLLGTLNSAIRKKTYVGDLVTFRYRREIANSWMGGGVSDKLAALSQYDYCICYESSGFDGFVTEKIFDAFVAGTIPIYYGAPDIYEYIPRDCFIDFRAFHDYLELSRFLMDMTEMKRTQYRTAARDFLLSSRYHCFSKEAFARQFILEVHSDFSLRWGGA